MLYGDAPYITSINGSYMDVWLVEVIFLLHLQVNISYRAVYEHATCHVVISITVANVIC